MKQIQFYPYDFDYKIEKVEAVEIKGVENKPYLYIYAKLENGQKICIKQYYQPYFYADLDSLREDEFEKRLKNLKIDHFEIVSFEKVEKEFLGKNKPYYKIFTNYPRAVPIITKEIQNWGIKCYEKDILFTHRYLRDQKIVPMCLTKAEGEFIEGDFQIPVFLAEKISPENSEGFENKQNKQNKQDKQNNQNNQNKHLEDWNILAVDIETYAPNKEINPEKNPILMIALYGKGFDGKHFKKVITWKKFGHELDYLEIVNSEAELIKRFKEIIKKSQPDIITGYFSDGFDFPYLKTRAAKHKIKLDLGLDNSEMVTGKYDTKIKGILHLDVFKFIRNIFGKNLNVDSLSLDSVANELLGSKKHEVDLSNLASVWDEGGVELEAYCKYNLQDSRLTFKLCEKLLPDMIEFTKIIGLPTFDLIRMSFSKLVESYIMKHAIESNVLAPNKPNNDEISRRMEISIKGAFVYEPTPGLYEDIIVFDFRSLYPTIISAHNIGPESLRCSCCEGKTNVPGKEEYWFCNQKKKFIPSLLENLITIRTKVKKEIKELKNEGKDTAISEARSYALKILANSFYGYLGFYAARWYCLEAAASTTAYARNYIKETIVKAENKGFEVIYADTDSCFLLLGEKTITEAMKFMDEINAKLTGQMELEFEGYFLKGIFVALKGAGKKGAKKKYALLKDDGKIKITGFESVRRNWSPLAKEVQQKVLSLVLQGDEDDAVKYVKEIVADLKQGKMGLNKLILKTQLTRELSYYTSIGPHVKVAHEMVSKGEPVGSGTIIEYVIVKGSGLVRERAKIPLEVSEGEYDPNYYLKHQLIPAVSSIFAVLGYSEDEIFAKSKQIGLGSFF